MSIDEVIYSTVTGAQPREISSVHSRGSLQSLNDDDTCPSLTFSCDQVPALLLFINCELTPTNPGDDFEPIMRVCQSWWTNKPPPLPLFRKGV